MDFIVAAAVLTLLVGGGQSPGVAESLPKGQLVENVVSRAAAGQRFTIYVPSTYDRSRPAPILYVMDPRGRARVGAKLFQPAAERYGYIVVSSHNTASDVPAEGNLRAMQAMWDDSHEWFAIDPRRVYVAGFSGTARLASLMARHMPNSITGIIGSAAAYHPDVRPSRETTFLYFGAIGDSDYNFHEMETLETQLVSQGVPHRIVRFPGAHSWLPPDRAAEAIEWFEQKAMQAGVRARDDASIDAWWQRDAAAAHEALASERDLDAGRRLSAMARDFYGLRDVAAVREQATRILASDRAKREVRRRQAAAVASDEWKRRAMQLISYAYPEGADAAAHTPVELARMLDLDRLKQTAEGSNDAALEARRRLAEMEVQLGFYLPVEAARAGDQPRASYYLGIALAFNERNPVPWYLLARSWARINDPDDAFRALQRAFDAGFRDLALLEQDPAFTRVKTRPEYAAFVERLRASGDTLDLLTVDRPPPLELPLR